MVVIYPDMQKWLVSKKSTFLDNGQLEHWCNSRKDLDGRRQLSTVPHLPTHLPIPLNVTVRLCHQKPTSASTYSNIDNVESPPSTEVYKAVDSNTAETIDQLLIIC